MKSGRPLPDVLMELQRQQDAKRDYISPATDFTLAPDGTTFSMGNNLSFATTDLFHRQVASILNIPTKYYDLMAKEDFDKGYIESETKKDIRGLNVWQL